MKKFGSAAALCIFIPLAIFVLVRLVDCYGQKDNYTLELVQVLFRHGERTPQKNEIKYLSNPSPETVEPWGFAQLTNNGKRQEYNIGRQLRRLYNDFLGDSFRPQYVYAQSTGLDRTKASLALVLAALYKPSDELLWNDNLKWLPIPINYVPSDLDNLFLLSGCPRYKKLWSELMESSEIKQRVLRYEKLFKYLSEFYPNTTFDIHQLFYLNNIIHIQRTLNISDPIWYSTEVHKLITEGAKFYLDTLSYTTELIKLNGGAMARRMFENMELDSETKTNPRRIYLYSGHEFTIYAFAKALNITLLESPSYGSALILEKLRDNQGEFYVKLNYWIGSTEKLITLKLNGCDKICPIDKFVKIIQPFLPTDDDLLCLYQNLKPTDLEKILRMDKVNNR